jgi:hypothetical protein
MNFATTISLKIGLFPLNYVVWSNFSLHMREVGYNSSSSMNFYIANDNELGTPISSKVGVISTK